MTHVLTRDTQTRGHGGEGDMKMMADIWSYVAMSHKMPGTSIN